MAYKGHVKWFNDRRGWGFVTGNDGQGLLRSSTGCFKWKLEGIAGRGASEIFELAEKGSKVRAVNVRRVAKGSRQFWPLKGIRDNQTVRAR